MLDDLPEARLRLGSYKDWVSEVVTYLQGFHSRVQPLQDLEKIMAKVCTTACVRT